MSEPKLRREISRATWKAIAVVLLPIGYALSAVALTHMKDTHSIGGRAGELIEAYNAPLDQCIRLIFGFELW